MDATALLPPVSAVRMVWALTGSFSNDPHSQHAADLVEAALRDIKERAQKDDKESQYAISAIATMDACLRSLDTVYKGRQLNFEENEKLRLAYLESVRDDLDFGKKAQDLLQSLPTMTIAAAGGVTIAQAIAQTFPAIVLTGAELWGIGLALAAAGYLVNGWFVARARRRRQVLYIEQDYERTMYYDQYLARVATILTSLYVDLNRIHRNVFGQPYPVGTDEPGEIVRDMLGGVRPSFCWLVHEHMMATKRTRKITPELWPLCETGNAEAVKSCPHWTPPASGPSGGGAVARAQLPRG